LPFTPVTGKELAMAELTLDPTVLALIDRGRIRAGDLDALRRGPYAGGVTSDALADQLFALMRNVERRDGAFDVWFCEAILAHLAGRHEAARWLLGRIGPAGPIETRGEYALALRILAAGGAMPILARRVLATIAQGVATGAGAAAAGRPKLARVLDEADLAAIRLALAAGEGSVDRAEADILLDIHAAASVAPAAEWEDLFVGAVVHHLHGASGHSVRPRAAAIEASAGLEPLPIAPEAARWIAARTRALARRDDAVRVILAVAGVETRERMVPARVPAAAE